MSYDCFISYASPDLPLAQALCDWLVAAGLRVWFDKARLRDGYNWHEEIEAGCEASRVVLPVLTHDGSTPSGPAMKPTPPKPSFRCFTRVRGMR
jgi:hypothetical protein